MKGKASVIIAYAQQAEEMERLIAGCPVEIISRRPRETGWSILEIVGHLADAELLASVRIRRLITQDRPNFYGYRQEEWAQTLFYRKQSIKVLVTRFSLLRRENADLLECIAEETWNHRGQHDQYGELTLSQLIEDYIEHTAKHLEQARSTAAELTNATSRNARNA